MLHTITDELLQLRATLRGRQEGLYAAWQLTACSTTCCCINPFNRDK